MSLFFFPEDEDKFGFILVPIVLHFYFGPYYVGFFEWDLLMVTLVNRWDMSSWSNGFIIEDNVMDLVD
jgi:hypothetical protein